MFNIPINWKGDFLMISQHWAIILLLYKMIKCINNQTIFSKCYHKKSQLIVIHIHISWHANLFSQFASNLKQCMIHMTFNLLHWWSSGYFMTELLTNIGNLYKLIGTADLSAKETTIWEVTERNSSVVSEMGMGMGMGQGRGDLGFVRKKSGI